MSKKVKETPRAGESSARAESSLGAPMGAPRAHQGMNWKLKILLILMSLAVGLYLWPRRVTRMIPLGHTAEEQKKYTVDHPEILLAKAISDMAAGDLVKGDFKDLNDHLGENFIAKVKDQAGLESAMDKIFSVFGTPTQYDYKTFEVGTSSVGEENVPIAKFTYAVKTTKYLEGHFLVISMFRSPLDARFKVGNIGIITFPSDVPPWLK
jgi:hypothetical protein